MLQSFFQDNGDIQTLEKAIRDVHPMRQYGTPDDVTGLVNWLAEAGHVFHPV